MSAQHSITELIQTLRSRAERYKLLADGLYDRRTAAEIAAYSDELEAEVLRLQRMAWPSTTQGWQDDYNRA